MRILICLLLSLDLVSQCPVSIDDINPDDIDVMLLLELERGDLVASSDHEDWIYRLELIECSTGDRRMTMYTSSKSYSFKVPNLASAQRWMSSQHPSRYYHEEVKPNPREWSMAEEFHQFSDWERKRCGAFRPHGPQCRRYTYSEDARCWQHKN